MFSYDDVYDTISVYDASFVEAMLKMLTQIQSMYTWWYIILGHYLLVISYEVYGG